MIKHYIPLVIVLFALGIALRAVEVVGGNYLFGFDQGRDYLAAYNIVENHKLTLIGPEIGAGSAGISNIFHGPGYYYSVALMYMLFHGDPYGGLVLMFIFGVAALILSFVTVRKMFGKLPALLALFLVGVSPLIAPQSRFMWNSHPTSFFIVLAFYCVYLISVKSRLFAPLAIFFSGIIYHFELAIAVPMVVAVCLSLPVIYKIKDWKTYFYSFCAGILAFSPALLFEMRHGWMAVQSLWHYVFVGTFSSHGILLLRISDHVQSYINNAKDSFVVEGGFLPIWIYKILGGCLFISLPFLVRFVKNKQKRKFFLFSFLTLCTSYIILLFLNNAIWNYYLIHAHFIYIYVFACAAAASITKFHKSKFYKATFFIFGIFIISMMVASAKRVISNWGYDLHDLGGVEKIIGKRRAIDYIYRDAKGKAFSVFTFMAPIYTYPYDYLFKTYGKNTYGYVPGNEKKGLVYLLIELDGSKPWTYKGWLETVIVGGEIIKTVTIPTGHIIQVRQFQ